MYNLLKEVYVGGWKKDYLNSSKSVNGLEETLRSNQVGGRVTSLSEYSAPIIRIKLEDNVDINKLLPEGIQQVSFDDDATMGIIVDAVRRMLFKMEMRGEIEVSEEGITLGEKYFKKVRVAGQKSKKIIKYNTVKRTGTLAKNVIFRL